MSVVGKFARMLVYPVVRPMEQIREASGELRVTLAKAKDQREKHRAELAERAKLLEANPGAEVTAEQMMNPALIADPFKRFEVIAELNNWTDPELGEQLVSVRRGKRFAVFAGLIVTTLGLTTILMAPAWIVFVLSPCLVVVVGYSMAQAFKYGLFQFQLEHRALLGGKDYFSQADFFRHLFW